MKTFQRYASELSDLLGDFDWANVHALAEDLRCVWENGNQVFVCGNGGSAANALHIANDLTYGIAPKNGSGMRVQALPANTSVLTCLANDISYDSVFSYMLEVSAKAGDLLIVLSGSGNSPNIIKSLETAQRLQLRSYAILGYTGGKCLSLADVAVHFPIQNMQISEDCQLIVGHMVMSWLRENPVHRNG